MKRFVLVVVKGKNGGETTAEIEQMLRRLDAQETAGEILAARVESQTEKIREKVAYIADSEN